MPASSTPQSQQAGDQPHQPSPLGEPFLRFYYPAELRARLLALLTTMEQAPDPTRHRNALSDLVMELTDSGLEYYYLKALDVAESGFVVKQSAHLGMASVQRVIGPVVHNIIGHMDKKQLIAVCGHIRRLME